MPSKRTRRPKRKVMDVAQTAYDHLMNRSMRERASNKENAAKAALMDWMEQSGDIELDEPIEFVAYKNGKPVTKHISGFHRQERTSQVFDNDAAMELLKKLDLVESCTVVTVHVDEDAMLGEVFDGKITEAQMKKLYTDKTTYALTLVEGDPEPDEYVEEIDG